MFILKKIVNQDVYLWDVIIKMMIVKIMNLVLLKLKMHVMQLPVFLVHGKITNVKQ